MIGPQSPDPDQSCQIEHHDNKASPLLAIFFKRGLLLELLIRKLTFVEVKMLILQYQLFHSLLLMTYLGSFDH